MDDDIKKLDEGISFITGYVIDFHFINTADVHVVPKSTVSNAAYTLLLPGKKLSLSVLNNQRKYRARGNLKGGLQAFHDLDAAGLGTIDVKKMHRGTAKVGNFISICILFLHMLVLL